jgi:dihydrofolate synthase/folylpolyglutamate synthase
MYPSGLPFRIVSLSGTNGKGSTAELLSSIYRQAGYRVGKFTSPHLVHFNERFNLNGSAIDNTRLLNAFSRVELVRGDTPITFFEYGTLLAIELFASSNVDIAIMEVGLGGRLDSVNILDADVAIVTGISIDHTSWLGNTIEEIAYEKTGIARKGRPLILGLEEPPETMLSYAAEIGANINKIGSDFSFLLSAAGDTWQWLNGDQTISDLPLPYKQAGVQLGNCALALKAIDALSNELPVGPIDMRNGILNATLDGRCQIFQKEPYIIFDVSHNEASVARLAQFLTDLKLGSQGKVLAVCGMLRDKEIKVSLEQIAPYVDEWHLATIHNERGALAAELSVVLRAVSDSPWTENDRVEGAYDRAKSTLTRDDCLVVFGSFHIVGDILDHVN